MSISFFVDLGVIKKHLCLEKSVMCLSQTTGYAIQALACMESLERKPCFIRDVAEYTGVPKPYLAQIINRLSHKGIVSAKRGYRGGIAVNRPAHAISLLEVVEAVEGKEWIGPCLLGTQKCCSRFVCPTHEFWTGIQNQIQAKLKSTTLADVIVNTGTTLRTRATARTKTAAVGVRNRELIVTPSGPAKMNLPQARA